MARMMLLVNNRCNRIEVFLRVSLRIFQINEKMHQGMTKIINVKPNFYFSRLHELSLGVLLTPLSTPTNQLSEASWNKICRICPYVSFYSHWQEIWQPKSFTYLPYFKLISCFIENIAFCQKQEQNSYKYRLVLDRLP